MYGKIFDSIYDGTLRVNWKALVTFQQMIVLCDADGVIDMTPIAIAGRTGIPVEVIKEGIEFLELPDPDSRTPDEDGRRIIRLDDHRPWGWHIVNHQKYKELQDADTRREQTRERVRRHRERVRAEHENGNDLLRDVTHGNGSKRHTDTDTDTERGEKARGSRKATRLTLESLPADWQAWATKEGCPNPQRVWEKFRDFWIAKAGKDGAKLDWFATWRNWVRSENDRRGGGSNEPPASKSQYRVVS